MVRNKRHLSVLLKTQLMSDDSFAPPGSADLLPPAPGPASSFLPRFNAAALDRLNFFGSFLRRPLRVGAFAPSSPALARAMLRGADLKNARAVVEFGPGTGAFTRLILDRIGRQTAFIALELGERQVRRLQRRFPALHVYHDSAEKIQHYLARHHRRQADCIISGLPWGNMPARAQRRIFDATLASLAPGGTFTTFCYAHAAWLPGSRGFHRWIDRHFAEVQTSRIIWRNAPPAFVYRCRAAGGG